MGTNGAGTGSQLTERVFRALDEFRIEVPSWGFANPGTRFGKFTQAGAATTIEEKFADAGKVNELTGAAVDPSKRATTEIYSLLKCSRSHGDRFHKTSNNLV